MKISFFFIIALLNISFSYATNAEKTILNFKMEGSKSETITLNETYTSFQEIFPFEKNKEKIYGLAVSADIHLENEESIVRLLLVDTNYEEYLILESYALLQEALSFSVEGFCEETGIMEGIRAHSIKIEVTRGTVSLKSISISKQIDPAIKLDRKKKEKKQQQHKDKINRINKNLKEKGIKWVAGPTSISELSYSERKKLYGQSTFPPAFEYYSGGIITTGSSDFEEPTLKSAATSEYVEEWDWRNRHNKNWITPVVNQGICGSCWSFAATGATEALANLYFNRQLNLDLSEQDLISYSGGGNCSGGYAGTALTYITKTGIVDEGAFPYTETEEPYGSKSSSPSELIKISGKVDFGSALYPRTEEDLKRLIIEKGPLSGGLYDWSHAMLLVGYEVVKEGDTIFYRDQELNRYWITLAPGDPLIGKTVWIFKNSWSSQFGDEGYVYVETPVTNMGWTHGLITPVISDINKYEVICEDNDGDGYYWWGLGEKPAACNGPDEPDGNDSDPTLGPIDQYGNCRILKGAPAADLPATNIFTSSNEPVNGNKFVMKLYPNPVHKNLVIELSSVEPGDTYTLYNMNGGKLKSDKIDSEQTIIDFSDQTPGIYVFELTKSRRIIREKIIKQ